MLWRWPFSPGLGVFIYLWWQTGASALAPSVAVQRFRQIERGGVRTVGPGPVQGVYLYRGSGTETISVPPKSQPEGPEIPGTVIDRPGGCFEFRLDYSDVHWQDWTYCPLGGSMVTTSKAGYYLVGLRRLQCRRHLDLHLQPGDRHHPCRLRRPCPPPGLVHRDKRPHLDRVGAHGWLSTVMATKTLRVGSTKELAVLVREDVVFSGGQRGSNHADTWFSVTTGLPLPRDVEHRGVYAVTRWHLNTPRPWRVRSDVLGTSALNCRWRGQAAQPLELSVGGQAVELLQRHPRSSVRGGTIRVSNVSQATDQGLFTQLVSPATFWEIPCNSAGNAANRSGTGSRSVGFCR